MSGEMEDWLSRKRLAFSWMSLRFCRKLWSNEDFERVSTFSKELLKVFFREVRRDLGLGVLRSVLWLIGTFWKQ